MGFRPNWMLSVYWFHDALIGYSILIPFKGLAILHPLSRAHMYLLYNNRFVKVSLTLCRSLYMYGATLSLYTGFGIGIALDLIVSCVMLLVQILDGMKFAQKLKLHRSANVRTFTADGEPLVRTMSPGGQWAVAGANDVPATPMAKLSPKNKVKTANA